MPPCMALTRCCIGEERSALARGTSSGLPAAMLRILRWGGALLRA
jgi:hypothetical protein